MVDALDSKSSLARGESSSLSSGTMKIGAYKHFKGDTVTVYYVAKHTETGEEFVIYEHKGKIWARPKEMFLEEVDKPEIGYKGPRFEYVG
jgi:hypothetical protein